MKASPSQLKILLYCISRQIYIYQSNPVSQTARWLKTTPTFICQGFPLSISICWGALGSPGCLWSPLCGVLKSFKTKWVGFCGNWALTQLRHSLLLEMSRFLHIPRGKLKHYWNHSGLSYCTLNSRAGTVSLAVLRFCRLDRCWGIAEISELSLHFQLQGISTKPFFCYIIFQTGPLWHPKCCSLHIWRCKRMFCHPPSLLWCFVVCSTRKAQLVCSK